MDMVGEWTERIALRLTPQEASFAAEAGLAYAAGGRRRQDLLPRHEVQPGAFGPGGTTELPFLLQALEQTYHVLRDLLGSPSLGNAIAAGSLLIAVRDSHKERHDTANATPPPVESAAPSANERQGIEQAFDALSGRLRAAGFAPERANDLTYGLLVELLSDTVSAAAYLDALSAVPSTARKQRRTWSFRRASRG
jgi:hypothetical protein